MNARIRPGLLTLLALVLAAIPLRPQPLAGQEPSARFRVLVPEIQPQNGADKKFGQRLAEQLRDLINDMPTHQPIDEKELKSALKQYDLDMKDLNCIKSQQLAHQIDAKVVFCGDYTAEGDNIRVTAKFVTSNGEEFDVDPIVVPEKGGPQEAAQHFYQALQIQSDQLRASQFCGDYYASNNYEAALERCNEAIQLNPNATGTRFIRAMILRHDEQYEESLQEFLRVLELDPLNEDAMQNAGWLSAMLGRDEDARQYYSEYLKLNPANAQVRMQVAYDLAKAGDPLGAMQFIEEGLEIEPDNVDLLKQHGGFAFAAGADVAEEAGATAQTGELPAEAVELYRKALASYERVYALEGADMDPAMLGNMVRAHIMLGDNQQAVDLAKRILETHGDVASLWSIYADALNRNGQVDEAIAALDKVKELDPEYATVALRQGNWLLQAGRFDDAIPVLEEAVDRGEQTADFVASTVLFGNGYNKGVDAKDWPYAIRVFQAARDFDVSDMTRQQLNFWLGYSIFQSARLQQEPQTLETAKATLPRFQQVVSLMQSAADYAGRNNFEKNRQDVLTATGTYIEIQEAIIKRGG